MILETQYNQLFFDGIKKGNDWYTLDGNTKISTRKYSKFIRPGGGLDDLTYEELKFLASEYITLNTIVKNHNNMVDKFKIKTVFNY